MARLRFHDLMCESCGYCEERLVDEDSEETNLVCPSCDDKPALKRVWIKAPSVSKLGRDGSDTSIAALQQSFRERYVKKEQEDVQHKHGKLYGDSIRSAAAQKIKKEIS